LEYVPNSKYKYWLLENLIILFLFWCVII
jgi:hypothetical protein